MANAKSVVIYAGIRPVSALLFAHAPPALGIKPGAHCSSVLDLMSRTSRINLRRNAEQDLASLSLKFRECRASDERDKIYALRAMSTDYRDTVKLSPDYDLPLPVVVSKLVGYLFETKRIAVSTVLDLLASFVSLTTVCLMPYLE